MVAFGAGTLPAVLTAGLLAGWVTRLTRKPAVRIAIGVSLIAFALASLWFTPDHSQHTGHDFGDAPHTGIQGEPHLESHKHH
jgi:hypothetical protein